MIEFLIVALVVGLCWASAYLPEHPDTEAKVRRQLDGDYQANPVAVRRGRIYKLHDPSVGAWEEWGSD